MKFSNNMKIGEARPLMGELIHEGQICPVCTRMAKVYKRKIHKAMAKSLIDLYKLGGTTEYVYWYEVSTSGNLANFRHWGILEEQEGNPGHWKLTDKGKEFIKGEIRVPKYSLSFDGEFIGLDDEETISIEEALGEPFDFHELMNKRI